MSIKRYRTEFYELTGIFKNYLFLLLGFFVLFFFFSLKNITIGNYNIPIIYPSSESFSVKLFEYMKSKFLMGYEVIVLNPLDSVLISIEIAFFSSFVLTFPYLVYSLLHFIFPALTSRERKVLLFLLVPFSILFFSGVLFSIYFLIPSTFKIFYSYSYQMSITPYFNAKEFISMIVLLSLSSGMLFTFPVFMIILTLFRITSVKFWKEYWRIFAFIVLAITAWITPDGTGITMIIMSLPLMILYFLAVIILIILEKRKRYYSKT